MCLGSRSRSSLFAPRDRRAAGVRQRPDPGRRATSMARWSSLMAAEILDGVHPAIFPVTHPRGPELTCSPACRDRKGVPMALRAAEDDEDALVARAFSRPCRHSCRHVFSRVFKGAAADSYPIHWTPEPLRGWRSPWGRNRDRTARWDGKTATPWPLAGVRPGPHPNLAFPVPHVLAILPASSPARQKPSWPRPTAASRHFAFLVCGIAAGAAAHLTREKPVCCNGKGDRWTTPQ
jgi:hypothetical protein